MDFLEKDLEDIIWECIQTDNGRKLLCDRGLAINGKLYRQLELGDYGRLDLLSVSINRSNIFINVYELKKGVIDTSVMLQAARYGSAIREYIDKKYPSLNREIIFEFILIGKYIDLHSDFVFLYNMSDAFTVYHYTYQIDGIRFVREDKCYQITNNNLLDTIIPVSRADILEMKNKKVKLF